MLWDRIADHEDYHCWFCKCYQHPAQTCECGCKLCVTVGEIKILKKEIEESKKTKD